MIRARLLLIFTLAGTGCPGPGETPPPPEIDVSLPRRYENEGKKTEALVEYAKIVADLKQSGRTDARAHAAWGRILMGLRRLDPGRSLIGAPMDLRQRCAALEPWCIPGGLAFLSAGAAGHWNQLLAMGEDAPVVAEAAASIADLFAEKLDDASLRRGKFDLEGEISERLYRRCLAQAAVEYARYCASRLPPKDEGAATRVRRLLKRYAKETRELAGLSAVLEVPASRWAEMADKADADAISFRRNRDTDESISNDLRQEIELDTNGLLQAAGDYNNKANDLLSRRADEAEILDALERSLRHFVAGRESLVEPTPSQRRRLDVMVIAVDALRHQAFKN